MKVEIHHSLLLYDFETCERWNVKSSIKSQAVLCWMERSERQQAHTIGSPIAYRNRITNPSKVSLSEDLPLTMRR
jgi:hypothetical protein